MNLSNGLNLCGLSLFSLLLVAVCQTAVAENPAEKEKAANPHSKMMMPPAGMGAGANPHGMAMGSPEGANPHQMGSFAVADRKNVSWTLPAGWSELPPTSMRMGNFLYTHSNGQKVEITVVSLPGNAGGQAANFDMWRAQLALPQIDEAEVLKQSEKIKAGDLEMTMVDFVSTDNLVENKFKARINGAIYVRGESTWFFKMKGEDEAVKSLKENFLSFLKSLKFEDVKK